MDVAKKNTASVGHKACIKTRIDPAALLLLGLKAPSASFLSSNHYHVPLSHLSSCQVSKLCFSNLQLYD